MADKKKRKLRSGFTTGTAAAAATGGALTLMLDGKAPKEISIALLTGDNLAIPVATCVGEGDTAAVCTVVKDAGDDPDVTHRAVIGAKVSWLPEGDGRTLVITGGTGVGKVTKPGLEVPVGEAAINPGPQKMISQTVSNLLKAFPEKRGVHVEIFVPKGKILAEKTLNARLGIIGGISILGTTGIVRPMSHDAYIATIKSAMAVARAAEIDQLVLTTGRRSEKFAQAHFAGMPEEAFIQVGDFFKLSVDTAAEKGLSKITLAVFFGKAIKMAQGVPHTHAAKSSLSLSKLSGWTLDATGDRKLAAEIENANTGRQAFFILMEKASCVIPHVGSLMLASARCFAEKRVAVQAIIFDFDGNVVFDSDKTDG